MGKYPYFPNVETQWKKKQKLDSLSIKEITTPSNPDANYMKLYFKSDGKLYKLNSSGVETVSNSTVSAITQALLDAKANIASPTFTGTVAIPNVANLETAIVANTAKTGITAGQSSAITANTAKTGITAGQSSAITANTAKISSKMQLLSDTALASGWTSAVVDLSAYTFSDYSEFIIFIDGGTQSSAQELRLNATSGGTGLATLYTNSIWWDNGGTNTINGGAFTYWTLADTAVFAHLNTEWKYKVSIYPDSVGGSRRWLSWEGLIGTNVPSEKMLIGQGLNQTATGQNSTFEFYPSTSSFHAGNLIVYGVLR